MLTGVLGRWLASIPTVAPRERIDTIIATLLDGFDERDPANRLSLFTADAVVEMPVGLSALRGREALARYWRDRGLWDMRPRLDGAILVGNEALCRITMTARTAEETVTLPGYLHLVFANTLEISRMRCFYDAPQARPPAAPIPPAGQTLH